MSKYRKRPLHPATADLVRRFSAALAEKLSEAEQKHGCSDGWRMEDWMDECRERLEDHLRKGDPLDVAAYCAFLWHHGAPTYDKDDCWRETYPAPAAEQEAGNG